MKSFFDIDAVPKASNSILPRHIPPPPLVQSSAYNRY
jgi:hypothetical protein